jgi:aerotaxis receptor
VIKIDDITQQNAALVEQAAAAGNLAQQTRCVSQAMAVFKLQHGGAQPKRPGAAGVNKRPLQLQR